MSPTIQSGRNYKVSGNYMFVLLQDSKLLKNFFYWSQLYKLWPRAIHFITSRAIIADFSYFLILHFLSIVTTPCSKILSKTMYIYIYISSDIFHSISNEYHHGFNLHGL